MARSLPADEPVAKWVSIGMSPEPGNRPLDACQMSGSKRGDEIRLCPRLEPRPATRGLQEGRVQKPFLKMTVYREPRRSAPPFSVA